MPEEIQVADLLRVEVEVADQGIMVAGHHLHTLLMEGETVVEIAKAHQQEVVAHHQVMEEEPVASKVLLHGAKELHIN